MAIVSNPSFNLTPRAAAYLGVSSSAAPKAASSTAKNQPVVAQEETFSTAPSAGTAGMSRVQRMLNDPEFASQANSKFKQTVDSGTVPLTFGVQQHTFPDAVLPAGDGDGGTAAVGSTGNTGNSGGTSNPPAVTQPAAEEEVGDININVNVNVNINNIFNNVAPQPQVGFYGYQYAQVGGADMYGMQGMYGVYGMQGMQGGMYMQGAQGMYGNYGMQGMQGMQGGMYMQGAQGMYGNYGMQGMQGGMYAQGAQGMYGNYGMQGMQGGMYMQGGYASPFTNMSQGLMDSLNFAIPSSLGSANAFLATGEMALSGSAEEQMGQLQDMLNNLTNLKSEYSGNIQQLEGQIATLTQQLQQLQQEQQQLQYAQAAKQQELQQVGAEQQKMQQQKQQVSQQTAQLQSTQNMLNNQISMLDTNIQSTTEQIELYRQQAAEMALLPGGAAMATQMEMQATQLEAQKAQLIMQRQQAQCQLQQNEAQLQQLNMQAQQIDAALPQLDARVQQLQQELATITQQLQQVTMQVSQLEQQVALSGRVMLERKSSMAMIDARAQQVNTQATVNQSLGQLGFTSDGEGSWARAEFPLQNTNNFLGNLGTGLMSFYGMGGGLISLLGGLFG